MEVGYWSVRGLATPIFYMLEHANAEYSARLFDLKGNFETGFDGSDWFSIKESFGLSFPNIPYVIDGDMRLTQTNTIIRYIARKFNLMGKDLKTNFDVEQSLDALTEIKDAIIDICYARDFSGAFELAANTARFNEFKGAFKVKFAKLMSRFEQKLASNASGFLCGDELTAADFVLMEESDVLASMFGENFLTEKLKAHRAKIVNLPKVMAYRSTEAFKKQPINNWCAIWKGEMDGVIEC